MNNIRTIPSGAALGAEIRGLELSGKLNGAEVGILKTAWKQHLVLVFRKQVLSDTQLINFSRYFGSLDLCPPNATGKQYVKEHPELTVVSNRIVGGEPIGSLGDGEVRWHTDMSNHSRPPKASILYALEVSKEGGQTEFCNLYQATSELPKQLLSIVRGKMAYHDGTYDSSGAQEFGVEVAGERTEPPNARHPLVIRHSVTNREVIYLGRRPHQYIVGMDAAESEIVLDKLWSHSTQRKYVWSHQWEVGDVVIWDNRCVMHRRNRFPPGSCRTMHRTQVTGDTMITG